MSDEPLFAMTHDWWTWDHARVREALQAARLNHLSGVVSQGLDANRRSGRRPGSWTELCDEGRIRRDPHNLMKIKRGQYSSSDLVLLGISTALGIDLRCLIPTTEEWIAQASVVLSNRRIQLADARAYVAARLQPVLAVAHVATNGTSRHVSNDAAQRSAAVLDPILVVIDQDLNRR